MQGMNLKYSLLSMGLFGFLTIASMASPVVIGASPKEGVINRAGPSGSTFSPALSGVNPWSLALHPATDQVFFSDPTAGRIAFFDLADPSVFVSLIKRPGSVFHGIFLDAPNNHLYFLDSSNDSVNRIDLDTSNETEIFAGAPMVRPNAIAYSAELGRIIVTDSGADAIHVFNPDADFPLVASYATADTVGAWGVAIRPSNQSVYYTVYEGGRLYVMDPGTGATKQITDGLDRPRGLKFDRKSELYCFEDGTGLISRINVADGTRGATSYGTASSGRGFVIFDDKDQDNDRLDDGWELSYASSLFTLDADSDPDGDGRTALCELLYMGSPLAPNDPPPVRQFTPNESGLVDLEFGAPAAGYDVQVWLSSDLKSGWQRYTQGFNITNSPGTIYSEWTAILDPVQLGLDADKLFVQLRGDAL